MRHLFVLLLTLTTPATILAQDKNARKPGDEMIEKYLAAEIDKLSKKFLDGATTISEWKQKRPRLHQEFLDMLGLHPLPEKTPLKATVTGTIEAHGVVVEKLHFQSKPGLYVTANLFRPKTVAKKLPAVVYVCGHANRGRDGNKAAYQDHGFWFANNGYVCIVLDTLQLGEIPGVHHGTYGRPWLHLKNYGVDGKDAKDAKDQVENRWWWHCVGYTPAGVEAWNGIRAIDYLCTRPEVDPDKIGVTGASGGGQATFWIAGADERVKVAVPVSGMSDLQSYIKDKVINGHCDCMFLYNTYQWDWTTIAAMIAPRPMLFVNSDNDKIFPMDGNRRVFEKLKKIYTMYGKSNLVDEYVSVGGHAYRPDLRVAVFRFMNKHLKRDTTTPVEDSAKYTPVKVGELRVFPDDRDLPKDAINARIDELFIPPAKVALPEKGKFEEWKKGMIAKLKANSFRNFSRFIPERRGRALMTLRISLYVEGDIEVTSLFFDSRKGDISKYNLVVLNKDDPKEHDDHPKWCIPFCTGHIWGIYPRGQGDSYHWTTRSPPNYVERSHVLLGKTIDRGRLVDILSLIDGQHDYWKRDGSWRIAGRGQDGILAAYAALFEPSIKEVIVIDPPKTHRDGPYFLNVMRVLDIPEALGLLAPTPLTIIGGNDPAFDRTAEIYRLAGAADKLKRK